MRDFELIMGRIIYSTVIRGMQSFSEIWLRGLRNLHQGTGRHCRVSLVLS